jgi:ketosteroid isomerase-like protein
MPRQTSEAVRQPLVLASTSRRPLEANVLRFRRLVRFLARPVWRLLASLPPRSGARRAIVRYFVKGCFEALNRGDLEVAFGLYHPDVESLFDRRMVSLGLESVYRGWDDRVAMQRHWNAEWGDWQFEPQELIYVGNDRLLVPGTLKGIGLSSGIAVGQPCSFVFTISDGLVINEQVILDHREAFEAAGLAATA